MARSGIVMRVEVVMTPLFQAALVGGGHGNQRRGDAICSPRPHGRVRSMTEICHADLSRCLVRG